MNRGVSLAFCLLAVFASLFLLAVPVAEAEGQRLLITQSVDAAKLVTLQGNTRPEARAKYDRGAVADSFAIDHIFLLLKRSPEQEQALKQFIDELTDPSSKNFHQWLTAKEFGEKYGVANQDRETIKNWLRSYGFKVNVDYVNGVLIDFSGNAGQVREAFHTQIHQLDVKGVKRIANMSDPKIPVALAPAVVGIVSLNDFPAHAMNRPKTNYTVGGGNFLVVPGDLETIYNLNPLFSAGISGQGQTIVVIEDTDVFTTADWTSFRSVFGLSSFTQASFTQIHPAPPSGSNNCVDPGANGDQSEAILDAEYASASAPSAAIVLASCKATAGVGFGGLVAVQNLLNESSTPPSIMSMSYGQCEALTGATLNAAFNTSFQQAATEGVSVFVSSGDDDAAGCDRDPPTGSDTHGIAITGWGSSPYVVSVGGTDYGDTFAGTNSTYWSATNSPTYESALSYIPEIPWNDSCASVLWAEFNGFSQTYGTTGFCNSSQGSGFLDNGGGSGGPSGCATGAPSTPGVVSGTCAGWAKPSYQSLVGNPSDSVRDIPDVSLFAANGLWGHYYPFCWSNIIQGGVSCSKAPDQWPGAGGTSFSSPIMAGIQALINQKAGGPQGNPNPTYYQLARNEYGASGDSSCNSTLGNKVGSGCIFYDVTQGDMDSNCTGTHNCFLDSASIGVLSTSNTAYQPAYGTTTGWDFSTGIGTVNAANLVNNWPGGGTASYTLSASPNSLNIAQGAHGTSTITITPQNGFSGSVTLSTSALPSGVTSGFSPNPATTTSTLTLTASASAATGTSTVTVTGKSGSLTATTTVSLTVTANGTGPAVTVSPASLTWGNIVVGAIGAKKAVTLTNTGTSTLNISGITTSGDFGQAASTKPCGATLAAGKNCKIEVTFTPTQVGARTGTLTISDNSPSSPQTVALSGTGTVQATLTPVTATFTSEKVGVTSPAKTFTLTNKQAVPLTGISAMASGDFSVSATTCSSSLAAKAKCTISVVFKPTVTGTRTGTLSVADSAIGSPQTSSLKGTGK
jgi:Pro-kumamolisin, activation domain/Abnormal spindle-like microcephaly-assoc'd, ASPM-SPD-2-Hydin